MLSDSGFRGEAWENAQKLVSLHTWCGLHGERKLSRNWPHLLGFSCLGPISWGRSPKEVTLIKHMSVCPYKQGHVWIMTTTLANLFVRSEKIDLRLASLLKKWSHQARSPVSFCFPSIDELSVSFSFGFSLCTTTTYILARKAWPMYMYVEW
jgi:hypothetical protein